MYSASSKTFSVSKPIIDLSTPEIVQKQQVYVSHGEENDIQNVYAKTKERLEQSTQLVFSKEETLRLLEELMQFELGRFLLQNKGVNGYWTSYIILRGLEKVLSNDLEKWMLHRCPLVLATRERFDIFQKEIQKRLHSEMKLASIPCGVMDDLVTLNLQDLTNISFDGIDLDESSLVMAQENARKQSVESNCLFFQKNAWDLQIDSKYDLITSNGLNMYEPDDEKVIELYHNFYRALRPDGILITSVIIPPALSNIDLEDMKKQKAVFTDIVQVKWSTFRTEELTRNQLESVGFTIVEFKYDFQGIFPTVIAKKT
ncbi:MAG: hypothetical protein C5B43_00150 [Verrucomicrobia bacterium]|nr:MAG: hypothetical protein C5B43_00150 [Verrucomicrobiota bacterium]